MSQITSLRGQVLHYLHDRGATPDRSGDQTTQRYYWDTNSGSEVAAPAGYVTVQNAILDTPGIVPGTYIL